MPKYNIGDSVHANCDGCRFNAECFDCDGKQGTYPRFQIHQTRFGLTHHVYWGPRGHQWCPAEQVSHVREARVVGNTLVLEDQP